MLWRREEKVAVVRWLLTQGHINEALNLCSRSEDRDNKGGMSSKFLNADSISGLEIFRASVVACQNGRFSSTISSSSKAVEIDILFDRLHLFLTNWDPSLLESTNQDG